MKNILFITHKNQRCGVYQYGRSVSTILKDSTNYSYIHIECESESELEANIRQYVPVALIYNYHPSVLGWSSRSYGIPTLGIHHEPSLKLPGHIEYTISQDPSEPEHGKLFSPGRGILDLNMSYSKPDSIPIIGSFGFSFNGKGFDRLVTYVQEVFDSAVINLRLTSAYYGDNDGKYAKEVAKTCQSLIKSDAYALNIYYDFIDIPELVKWLNLNDINCFLYDHFPGRGISGPPDYALAAKKPIALTRSYMFKHLWDVDGIFIEDTPLPKILEAGITPLLPVYSNWSAERFITNYDNIITKVLQ